MKTKGLRTSQYESYGRTLIQFEVGCRKCVNLVKLEKGTYMCSERVHMDESPVIPIMNGRKTSDWNVCDGEDYNRFIGYR